MRRIIVLISALALFIVGSVALASHGFSDVPTEHLFHEDIQWMSDNGLTFGCNEDGTEFCPEDNVTRGQMAAFVHRLANSGVLDGGDPAGEPAPGEAGPPGQDGVDGKDGAPGEDGTDGKDGVSGYSLGNRTATLDGVTEDGPGTAHPFTENADGSFTVTRACADGKVALSGGLQLDSGAGEGDITINQSFPVYEDGLATGWTVVFSGPSNVAVLHWMTCATVSS